MRTLSIYITHMRKYKKKENLKTMKKRITLLMAAALTAALLTSVPVSADVPTQDRLGNDITLPDTIERVVSMAPSITQVIDTLGMTDLLVAVDTQTPSYVDGVDDLPQFDMMTPDCEQILALDPDVVFVTGMSSTGGTDPYAELTQVGICVVEVASSTSIEEIEADVQFISDCLGKTDEGKELVDGMEADIAEVKAIGDTITDKKTVLFEISALPDIYSFGQGAFLEEMLEILGAENIFADQEGWISVTEEAAVAADPDVILTSVNYIDDPVGEILSREGWEEVTAIANKDVYYIDTAWATLPNQNITKALKEMAKDIYPEEYADLEVEDAAA